MKTIPKVNGVSKIAPALLEGWMRQYFFNTEIDIGSSGVESFSLRELREIVGLTAADLDDVVFDDSRTLGAQGLREAVARRWGSGDPEQVIATHGSSESIYLIMNTLLRQGDEVVVLDPCYQQLVSIAESIGCRMRSWRLRFEQGFAPDLEELRRLINSRTRMVVVNFPHNPTGASLTIEQMKELIGVAAEVGAYLVWDAAFAELTYDAEPLPVPNHFYNRAVSIGTLSKAYGLPGLRVGWCLASPEVVASFVDLRDYITLHLSPLVELIAQRAVENADRLLGIRLPQARANLATLTDWVAQNSEYVEWVRPAGGVCAFLRFRHVPDVRDLCHRLARTCSVLLIPGACFNHPDHVRLGFGGPATGLQKGLYHLSKLLRAEGA